jgi:hypothetical protein
VREEVGSGRAMRVWQRMDDGGHEQPGAGVKAGGDGAKEIRGQGPGA